MTLGAVPPNEVQQYREQLWPMVVMAAETSGGEITAEELFSKALTGEFQMWAAVEDATILAILFTRLAEYPGLKSVELEGVAGGQFRKWVGLLVNIETWARAQGCTRIRLPRARKGWAPKLPDDYRITTISLEKKI